MKKKIVLVVFSAVIAMLLVFPAAAQTSTEQETAQEIAALINGYRAENGLYQYVDNPTLAAVAQKHTDYQVSIQLSTHAGEGGSTSKDRVTASGYGGGEFIFADEMIYSGGFATPEKALEWWKNSPIHNGIMLSEKYHEFGVGVRITEDKIYYTVNFGSIQGVTSPGVGSAPVELDAASPVPVSVAEPAQDGAITHVVVEGQTIEGIAEAYQMSPEELQVLNNLAADAELTAGQAIVVKQADSAAMSGAQNEVASDADQPVADSPASEVIPVLINEMDDSQTGQPVVPEGYTLIPNLLLTVLVVVAIVASAGVTVFAYLRLAASDKRR